MREIKFRAWSPSEKDWITDITTWIRKDDDGNISLCYPSSVAIQLIESPVLMQFTGLHDKNGKKIWEGDIIKFKETIAYDPEEFQERTQQVTFIGGAFSPVFFADWSLHDEDDKPMKIWDVEVLGNIYEHKHLLLGDVSHD